MRKIMSKYQKLLSNISLEISKLPEGRLVKKNACYYQAIGRKETGITGQDKLIQALCRKRFLLEFKKIIEFMLSLSLSQLHDYKMPTPEEIVALLPKSYQKVPKSYFYHPRVEAWLGGSKKQLFNREEGKFRGKNGVFFRSKSEFMIAAILDAHDVLYRYEMPMKMGGRWIYPDFVIINPYTGKEIIWEHFGALHLPEYEEKMKEKMKFYLNSGKIPFEDVIYTFEFDLETNNRLESLVQDILTAI